MNMTELKKLIKDFVIDFLDHRNLDADVEYFKDKPRYWNQLKNSTTENLAVFIWAQLSDKIKDPARLFKIRIWETENNIVEYTGQ